MVVVVKDNIVLLILSGTKMGLLLVVERIEYDPNRRPYIALMLYKDGERRYIIAPKDLKVGDEVMSGIDAAIKTGNCLPLNNIPVGTMVHCIEMRPKKRCAISAYCWCISTDCCA